MPALTRGDDGRRRCWWGASAPEYVGYHDEEWGRPVRDDRGIYERLVLEGFQSGLSWLTILRKRENFRAAFAGFEIDRVARFGERDVERLLGDAGIVRHRGKIEAAINNAKAAAALDALREGFRVTVDRGAVRGVDVQPGDSERALEEMQAAGASLA